MQGGVGSYIILCMVVAYLHRVGGSSSAVDIGGHFLGFLKYWGTDFNYDNWAVVMEPPGIVEKSPGVPVSDLPPT